MRAANPTATININSPEFQAVLAKNIVTEARQRTVEGKAEAASVAQAATNNEARLTELNNKPLTDLTREELAERSKLISEKNSETAKQQRKAELEDKFKNGEALTADENKELYSLLHPDSAGESGTEGSTDTELTPDQKLEKIAQEAEEFMNQALNLMAAGGDPDAIEAAWQAMAEKASEATAIHLDEKQKQETKDLITGIINPDKLKQKPSTEMSHRRQQIRDRLTELGKLRIEALQVPQTLKALKNREREANNEFNKARGRLGTGTPTEAAAAQMQFTTATDRLAAVQEQIRNNENKADEINIKQRLVLNDIDRLLGNQGQFKYMLRLAGLYLTESKNEAFREYRSQFSI